MSTLDPALGDSGGRRQFVGALHRSVKVDAPHIEVVGVRNQLIVDPNIMRPRL